MTEIFWNRIPREIINKRLLSGSFSVSEGKQLCRQCPAWYVLSTSSIYIYIYITPKALYCLQARENANLLGVSFRVGVWSKNSISLLYTPQLLLPIRFFYIFKRSSNSLNYITLSVKIICGAFSTYRDVETEKSANKSKTIKTTFYSILNNFFKKLRKKYAIKIFHSDWSILYEITNNTLMKKIFI